MSIPNAAFSRNQTNHANQSTLQSIFAVPNLSAKILKFASRANGVKTQESLGLVNKNFHQTFEIFAQRVLDELNCLKFPNNLENIFSFPPNISAYQKVRIIIKVIEDYIKKPVTNLVEDYKNFYISNMREFWEKLPGGKEFSEEIRHLSIEEKLARFQIWILNLHIHELHLSNSKLAFIPLEINRFSNLRFLFITNNQITVIPCLNLPKLEAFYVYGNKISYISKNLLLPKLTMFDLSGNQISKIPNLNLPTLGAFILNNNKIKEIPKYLPESLYMLFLRNNKIRAIPQNLNLPKLNTFNLEDNKIRVIPQNLNLPNLRTLSLANNQINSIPNSFKLLPELKIYLN